MKVFREGLEGLVLKDINVSHEHEGIQCYLEMHNCFYGAKTNQYMYICLYGLPTGNLQN